MASYGPVGARVQRPREGVFLSGKARYLDDIEVAGMLHVAFVRSPHAHARIGGIGTARAAAVDGVRAVLTLADLAGVATAQRMPLIAAPGTAAVPATPFILADKEVAFAEGGLVGRGSGDLPRHAGESGREVVVRLGRTGELDAERALGL